MNYSNDEILRRINKAKNNKNMMTHISNKSLLTIEEKMKISLCKHFVQFVNENKMKIKDLSELTKIPTSRISEINNYKIKKFTLDQLIKYLDILANHSPKVREYLNFIGQAVEVPTLKVSESKRLTKGLKEVVALGAQSSMLVRS